MADPSLCTYPDISFTGDDGALIFAKCSDPDNVCVAQEVFSVPNLHEKKNMSLHGVGEGYGEFLGIGIVELFATDGDSGPVVWSLKEVTAQTIESDRYAKTLEFVKKFACPKESSKC